jgi:hypothetical protein
VHLNPDAVGGVSLIAWYKQAQSGQFQGGVVCLCQAAKSMDYFDEDTAFSLQESLEFGLVKTSRIYYGIVSHKSPEFPADLIKVLHVHAVR